MSQREILLRRYLDKTITTAELEELKKIMSEDDVLEDQLFSEIESDILSRKDMTQEINSHVANKLFFERDQDEVVPVNRFHWKFIWRAAAVIVFALGLGFYATVFKTVDTTSTTSKDELTPVIKISAEKPKFVVLPDNSTVILNAGSELSYPKDYGVEMREVFLKGEAFFDVQHDPSRKFIVRSSDITTTVLGTAFNVKALASQSEVIVTVSRGKVAVKDDNHEFGTITPNERFTVDLKSHACVRSKVNEEVAVKWTQDFLIIDNQTFGRAVEMVEEKYNVEIVVENRELLNCKVTFAFLEKMKLQDVLTVMSTLAKATYTVNGHDVTIHGGEVCK